MAVVKTGSRKIKNNVGVLRALQYITQDKKISEISCSEENIFISAQNTTDYFESIRKLHRKDKGILAHHLIQSFDPKDNLTPEEAHKIGLEFIKTVAPNYLWAFSTHIDKGHIHNHFILNSVNPKTGYKWHDNETTIQHIRSVSDKICKNHGLGVIEKPLNRSQNQISIYSAKKNYSWKVKLCEALDWIVDVCKNPEDFAEALHLQGFKVKFYPLDIVFVDEYNSRKSIKASTLQKQFGYKYSKPQLERTMGYFDKETNVANYQKQWLEQKEFLQERLIAKEFYDFQDGGEWARFEKYLFEQINKPEIIETEDSYGNIALIELKNADGNNMSAKINLLDVVKLKDMNIFFSALKKGMTATITFKNYNLQTFERAVDYKINPYNNSEIYKKLKATASARGEKLCYKVIKSETQLQKLIEDNTLDGKFMYFKKDDFYNVAFLKENENALNDTLYRKKSEVQTPIKIAENPVAEPKKPDKLGKVEISKTDFLKIKSDLVNLKNQGIFVKVYSDTKNKSNVKIFFDKTERDKISQIVESIGKKDVLEL